MHLRNGLKKGLIVTISASLMAATLIGCGGSSNTSSSAAAAQSATADSTTTTVEAIPAPELDTSRKSTANSDEKYNKVTIGLADDPKDLGPTGYGATSYMIVTPNYYESLFDLKDNDYVPILAKGYTEVDDLHWDVQLYENIQDSEGNPITASDVVFSYKIMQESGKAVKYDYFDSVKALDDYTVEFTWTKPVDSVGALEWPWCRTWIFSQKAYEEGNFTTNPVGTGPYKVTEYVAGSHLSLTANENYWQSEDLRDPDHEANVTNIDYDIIAETSQHVIALSTGEIQYSQYVPGENMKDFEDGGQFADSNNAYVTQGSALEVLMANNTEGKITADPNFRLAMWYALDNNAIATSVGTYLPSKAFGTAFFSDYYTSWETAEGNYQATMDIEKAQEYLKQTNYNGETLVLFGTSDEATKSALTMIQSLLLNIGIKTEIKTEDGNMLESDMLNPDNWDILYKDCGGGSQVGEYNRFTNREEFGTGVNMAFINDDKLQELFTTAAALATHDEENITNFVNYVQEQGYYYAVCSPEINAVYSNAFATLAYHEGEFLRPGACDYYLD
jgi:peptide/nickel transport system substrate-binding protein